MRILTKNQGTSFIANNPIGHSQLKHVVLDMQYVRERTEKGELVVQHISGTEQWVDILTKALPLADFERQ